MKIRKYKSSDKYAVLNIHFETYFIGKSAKNIIDNKKYIDEEVNYYLNKEPESIFVAEEKGKVIGYLFGCLDDKKHSQIKEGIIKNIKTIIRYPFMSKKDRKFWAQNLNMTLNAITRKTDELKMNIPKNSGHLHINLLDDARGKGTGTKLLAEFFKYAKKHAVKTLHADSFETKLNKNQYFWLKNGFKIHSRGKTSFWKAIYPNEKINIVYYVKELK
jgi:GNAT superfamily N-acetyltransferase